jgi:hypothetical protein
VARAVEEPLKQIAINAGLEGGVVVERVRNLKGRFPGPERRTGDYEDLFKAGVIDAAKVTRSALQNAASIAALFLTTEAVVVDKPEDKGPAMPPGGGMEDSYVSLTEVSEYAAGVPEELRQARLYPTLPPEGMPAMCFYPMSKRRAPGAENWYALSFDERMELMRGHGSAGREFRGRVLQLVTGSTGLDDWEWGVTLFGVHPDDLKECVYAMRFDEASTRYAEFGPFYTGVVGGAEDVLGGIGVR